MSSTRMTSPNWRWRKFWQEIPAECTPYKDPEALKDALLSGDFDLNPGKKEEAGQ